MLGVGVVEDQTELLIKPVAPCLVVTMPLSGQQLDTIDGRLGPLLHPLDDLIHQIGADTLTIQPRQIKEYSPFRHRGRSQRHSVEVARVAAIKPPFSTIPVRKLGCDALVGKPNGRLVDRPIPRIAPIGFLPLDKHPAQCLVIRAILVFDLQHEDARLYALALAPPVVERRQRHRLSGLLDLVGHLAADGPDIERTRCDSLKGAVIKRLHNSGSPALQLLTSDALPVADLQQ